MIGIYHNADLDGFTSGAIMKRKYPDIKLIGYDYNQPFEVEQEDKGKPIIMADVSMKMPDMLKLAEVSNWQFKWIDHHKSAIEDYKKFVGDGENFLTPVLQDGISACEGTWNNLFPNEKMPRAILLLGEYDTWRNKDKNRWENEILPFQFGMRIICNSAETFPDYLFIDNDEIIESIIEKGKVVLKYQGMINEQQCKKAAFECEFEGLRAICLNGGGFNSDVFKSVYDESKHDIMIPFQYTGKEYKFSIYTTKDNIDCSVLAKKHGGGGHAKAAGMSFKVLPENFKSQKSK